MNIASMFTLCTTWFNIPVTSRVDLRVPITFVRRFFLQNSNVHNKQFILHLHRIDYILVIVF